MTVTAMTAARTDIFVRFMSNSFEFSSLLASVHRRVDAAIDYSGLKLSTRAAVLARGKPKFTGVPMSEATVHPIACLRSVKTRSISPENLTGAAGGGARATEGTASKAARDLGPGWKVSPSVVIEPGEVLEIADIKGSGVITHIWMTTHFAHWRTLILRAYWDNAPEPAVEVPYGDFFCNGWSVFAQVSSQMVASNPSGGFNSYWPMPFRDRARMTIENTSEKRVILYYQVTYDLGEPDPSHGYFHAQWRRNNPLEYGSTHTVVENVAGRGHFAGMYVAWGSNSMGWWGEGEVKVYVDGDDDYPTICYTGTEDYFGGAWNYDVPGAGYVDFNTPFLGMPQVIRPDGLYSSQQRFGLYRWHVLDPISFASALKRVEIQALGWRSGWRYLPLQDDIASTCFFYLSEPVAVRPSAPTFDSMEVHIGVDAMPDLAESFEPRPPLS